MTDDRLLTPQRAADHLNGSIWIFAQHCRLAGRQATRDFLAQLTCDPKDCDDLIECELTEGEAKWWDNANRGQFGRQVAATLRSALRD